MWVQAEVFLCDLKRQILFDKKNYCEDNTDCLGENSCDRGTGCVHVETCNKYQVTENIYDACDKYKKQRRLAVSESTENRRKQVVGDDEEDSATAYTDVNSSQFYSFCRSLHQDCDWMRKTNHNNEQSN